MNQPPPLNLANARLQKRLHFAVDPSVAARVEPRPWAELGLVILNDANVVLFAFPFSGRIAGFGSKVFKRGIYEATVGNLLEQQNAFLEILAILVVQNSVDIDHAAVLVSVFITAFALDNQHAFHAATDAQGSRSMTV
jgi:hypothetical protein